MNIDFQKYRLNSLLLVLLLFSIGTFAQSPRIDSLKQSVASSKGEAKAKTILLLISEYPASDTATTFPLFRDVFKASREGNYDMGTSQYFFGTARALSAMGDKKGALKVMTDATKYVDTALMTKVSISYFVNLGGIYTDLSDPNNGSRAYLKALQFADKINDTLGIARSCHGMGFVAQGFGDMVAAEKYDLKAKKYYSMLGMRNKEASMDGNLGSLFLSQAMKTKKESDYKKALDYLNEGLRLATKIGEQQIMALCYNNLASLYGSKNELDICLEYNFKGLEIRKRQGLQYGISSSLGNIAHVYLLKGRPDLAEKYLREAIGIGESIHAYPLLAADYDLLSDILASKKKFEEALRYKVLAKNLGDSINNAESMKSITDLERKYDTEKKDKEIELLNQTQTAKDAEIASQHILNYAIGLGLFLVIIFSFFILRSNRARKKANDELHLKNEIIEEKNKDITDSINYAKRIQDAILPDWELGRKMFSDAFILLKPRDIVSGDFYWFSEKNGKRLIAAVDCTGHGVPGAFMSMIGNAFLNGIVNERGITEPGTILSELRHLVIKALKQKGAGGEQRDGMDISLLSVDAAGQAEWAGANNPLWIIRKGELIEYKPDKRPIAFFWEKDFPLLIIRWKYKKGIRSIFLRTDMLISSAVRKKAAKNSRSAGSKHCCFRSRIRQ